MHYTIPTTSKSTVQNANLPHLLRKLTSAVVHVFFQINAFKTVLLPMEMM